MLTLMGVSRLAQKQAFGYCNAGKHCSWSHLELLLFVLSRPFFDAYLAWSFFFFFLVYIHHADYVTISYDISDFSVL